MTGWRFTYERAWRLRRREFTPASERRVRMTRHRSGPCGARALKNPAALVAGPDDAN